MTPAAIAGDDRRSLAIGLALAFGSSVGLGLAVAIARFAYLGGTNGITVAAVRAVTALALMYLVCVALRRPLGLPRGVSLQVLLLGLCVSISFYGNIASVQYISVGLSALIFFTFPPMIAVVSFLLGERATGRKIAAVSLSFFGLALMLGLSAGDVDLRGVALALIAACAVTCNAVLLQRTLRRQDPMVITFWLTLVAAPILIAAATLSGEVRWPISATGWWGLAGVAVLQSACIPLWYLAIARIGALRSGVVSNVQPVVSIVAAWLLFGEVLTAVQFLGGALVLGGVLLMQARRA